MVKIEGGNQQTAKKKRSMDIKFETGRICTVNNVLHVLEMKNNLVRTAVLTVKLEVYVKDG